MKKSSRQPYLIGEAHQNESLDEALEARSELGSHEGRAG